MEFNLAQLHEAIAEVIPDRECILFRDRRLSWADVTERSRRFANHLLDTGLEVRAERSELSGWESGQPHVALYMHNGNEYLEGMLGAYKARCVPFNVNYRYVEEELVYLLNDAGAEAIVYHAQFAPRLASILPKLPKLRRLIQVEDGSAEKLLPGAVEYEAALAAASADRPPVEWSPDDLYMLYTGGTTGMPKGVLWRQHDVFVAALGGRGRDGSPVQDLAEISFDVPRTDRNLIAIAHPPSADREASIADVGRTEDLPRLDDVLERTPADRLGDRDGLHAEDACEARRHFLVGRDRLLVRDGAGDRLEFDEEPIALPEDPALATARLERRAEILDEPRRHPASRGVGLGR